MEAPIIIPKSTQNFIYQYNLNDIYYEIELSTSDNKLKIKVTNKSKVEGCYYFYENSLENIYKINRYFLVFENIEEIKENLIEIVKNKENVELKPTENNEFKLIFKVTIGNKIINIEFNLTKKENGNDSLITILVEKVNFLEKENQNLKNRIKEFEEMFKEEIKEKNIFRQCLIGNSIDTITKFEEYNLIKHGVNNQIEESINKVIKLKLIYKSSRDGHYSEDFHKFCDNKGPTVNIIRTKTGTKFGGFLSKDWKSEGGDQYDSQSFLFSFNRNKIYMNNGNYSSVFEKDKGPYFAYSINIFIDFAQTQKHYVRDLETMKKSWLNASCDFELNEGREYFDIQEIEVFQVLFE